MFTSDISPRRRCFNQFLVFFGLTFILIVASLMNSKLQSAIEKIIGQQIVATSAVTGGDINDAFQITTDTDTFFVKSNEASFASDMFAKEAKGLELIQKSNTIPVPDIIGISSSDSPSFLILEWIEPTTPAADFWKNFGQQLALMHQTTATDFGLDHSNYIGSLVQQNESASNAVDFLINQRLLPQIELAKNSNKIDTNTINQFEKLFKRLPEIIPAEKPALIHGDLWNGNYRIGPNGKAILIDPSVSFGLREMDLAMTKLFGGFPTEFYDGYESIFPTKSGLESRIPIYQLYYLMVHVNLFGGGYLGSVKSILNGF